MQYTKEQIKEMNRQIKRLPNEGYEVFVKLRQKIEEEYAARGEADMVPSDGMIITAALKSYAKQKGVAL